jgi:DNA-directed RNA polymerase specialized sigma24 family protein
LGIDLSKKHGDIRRLTAKFGMKACLMNRWDFEELLSDVYVKIAASNQGLKPYDPTRSTLGHYVVLVVRSVITNKWRKSATRSRLASTVAIDDATVHLATGHDLDHTIDAERAWSDVGLREPVLAKALVEFGGANLPARRATGVGIERVAAVRRAMVAALGG